MVVQNIKTHYVAIHFTRHGKVALVMSVTIVRQRGGMV